jgi:hypothetical protein
MTRAVSRRGRDGGIPQAKQAGWDCSTGGRSALGDSGYPGTVEGTARAFAVIGSRKPENFPLVPATVRNGSNNRAPTRSTATSRPFTGSSYCVPAASPPACRRVTARPGRMPQPLLSGPRPRPRALRRTQGPARARTWRVCPARGYAPTVRSAWDARDISAEYQALAPVLCGLLADPVQIGEIFFTSAPADQRNDPRLKLLNSRILGASRRVDRLTPKHSHRSRLGGSLSPGLRSGDRSRYQGGMTRRGERSLPSSHATSSGETGPGLRGPRYRPPGYLPGLMAASLPNRASH